MPGFDKSLDAELFSKEKEFDRTKLRVSVFSYNNGPKKLQISRENKNSNGEYSFTKMGRLSKQEMESILPFIQEALQHMG